MPIYPSYPIQFQVRNGDLLPGICFKTEQQRLNAFSSVQYIELPAGFSAVVIASSEPTVEQQSALWVQIDSFNNPVAQFVFSSQYGIWVWPHPWAPLDPRLVLFAGDAGDVPLLDGGNTNAVTDIDGPFWEINTQFTDRLPIGAGTVPEGVNQITFDIGTPAYPALRGVYFIGRTARKFLVP